MSKSFLDLRIILIAALILYFLVELPSYSLPTYPINTNNSASSQLYYYWDLRDRKSYIQVFNNSPNQVILQIEIFNTAANCSRVTFSDNYLANDAHIYDLSSLTRNDGTPISVALPEGGYGFAVVSVVFDVGGPVVNTPVLIGNFRIVDNAGYEYRANAVGFPFSSIGITRGFTFEFASLDAQNFSDVVGLPVRRAGPGFNSIAAGGKILAVFSVVGYDAFENPTSCPQMAFVCGSVSSDLPANSGLNLGINNEIRNSRGARRICPSDNIHEGFIRLTARRSPRGLRRASFFVGFIGLNNGDGTGSMDVFTPLP